MIDSQGSGGNIASHVVSGKMAPGMGGAMALVAMQHPKMMKNCNLPPTGMQCVDMIVTEKAVFEITEKGLPLKEIMPDSNLDDIQKTTDADFPWDLSLE